jgi:hypothetical protein
VLPATTANLPSKVTPHRSAAAATAASVDSDADDEREEDAGHHSGADAGTPSLMDRLLPKAPAASSVSPAPAPAQAAAPDAGRR